MITWNCDRCDRPIESSPESTGTKVACPHCGDVNIVPGVASPGRSAPCVPEAMSARRAGPPRRSDRAAALGLPPETGIEQRVLLVRPAMFRTRPVRYVLILLAVVAGAVGAGVFALRSPPSPAWAALCGLAALSGAGVWAYWKVLSLDATLEITTKRVSLRRGLLSRELSEIPHEDIQNIQIKQTFFERLMGVGQLGVSSAGQDDVEIVIAGVPRPYRVREMIDAYRGAMD
jgi:membrane protein YdbS with pleckstrin-like domain/predicted RNA-binding Zn-ribbon protein involved in translation (DUF1610 family)